MYHSGEQMQDIMREPFAIMLINSFDPFYFVAGAIHRQFGLDWEVSKPFETYNHKSGTSKNYDTYIYSDEENGLLYLFINCNAINQIKNSNAVLYSYCFIIIGRDCDAKSKYFDMNLLSCANVKYKEIVCSAKESVEGIKQKDCLEEISYDNGYYTELNMFDMYKPDVFERVKQKRNNSTRNNKCSNKEHSGLIENFRYDLQFFLYPFEN